MTLDLWLQPVTPEAVAWAEAHAGVLDAEESTRWKRYHRKESQDLFVVAHVTTRFALSADHDVEPGAWVFERGENGRPEVSGGPPELRFNLSHTDGMVAVVVHGDADAGVDVESPWRSANIESVSRRVFTDTERAGLLALPSQDQPRRFYQLWTLKESFIKAKGKGFAMPLSKFGFNIGDDDSVEFFCDPALDPDASAWEFSTLWPDTGHVVSTCEHRNASADRPSVPPRIRKRSFERAPEGT